MTPDERAAQWCGCGHRRTAHTFADLGECAGCPNGTCLSPFTEQLSWTDTDARDEIRRLQADAREAESLIDTLSGLLDGVAVALRGPAEPGTLHDWSRLPRESDEARAEVERLRDENDNLATIVANHRHGEQNMADALLEANAALGRVRALCAKNHGADVYAESVLAAIDPVRKRKLDALHDTQSLGGDEDGAS